MNLKVLTLNCNKGYVAGLESFLKRVLAEEKYDFILLQEVRDRVFPEFDSKMEKILGRYLLLSAFNPHVNTLSEIRIIYRNTCTLKESEFNYLSSHTRLPDASLGFLMGMFETEEGKVAIGSVHVHSTLRFLTREREIKMVKKIILARIRTNIPIIFGGDFNSGLPWEKLRNRKILGPEFVNLTDDSGPTIDSDYLEPSNLQEALIVRLFKFFHIRLRMKVDHIYADSSTAASHTAECRVLPDRVSDHSPVEVILRNN